MGKGDLSAGHGVSQQHAGREGVLGIGQAECFDLSFNTTPEFMLDGMVMDLDYRPFRYWQNTHWDRGSHSFPFHVCIHALPGLREQHWAWHVCRCRERWCSGVIAYA